MAKTSFNYKLEKISLDKSKADSTFTYKQFEFTSLTFKREKWLAQRLLFICVLFSILFKAVNFNYALSFILISSIFFYAQFYFIIKKGNLLNQYLRLPVNNNNLTILTRKSFVYSVSWVPRDNHVRQRSHCQ